jgi:ABC-type Fe3+/spermidine/putrescine transport system ATPase subunit
MTAIACDHLTKRFAGGDRPVLDALSLEVHSGELVAVLGASGAGKSTLLKLIAGIERPDAGDLRFGGRSDLRTAPHRRGAVLVFQNAYLFPFLDVAENVAFGLRVRRMPGAERAAEVARLLDLVGLPGIERRRPGGLSGGEQQRVALARALATRPQVLLLDEPFNSLDRPVRQDLREAVRALQRRLGITTLMVTHALGEAMAMSDRMALLAAGKVAACDRPARLFERPPCVVTARFVGVTTFLRGTVERGWIATTFGRLRVGDPARCGPAVYAIRPEHIRVQAEAGDNCLPGLVRSSVYRGEFVEIEAAVDGGSVRARAPSGSALAAPGARIHLIFPAEHLFAVEGEPAPEGGADV